MKRKAVIDFSHYTNEQLVPIAQGIHDAMAANTATYATPAVPLTALQTQIDDTAAKLVRRDSENATKEDIIKFEASRAALEQTLRVEGNYVNSVAQGNPELVAQSGFPSYETAHTPDLSAPEAPADLRVRQGTVSGSIDMHFKPDRQHSTNEVQTNAVNPSDETAWHTKSIIRGGRATLDGFTPGVLVWFRVRTVGLKGVMGAWSDIAQIRVV